jgi:hypothetical protein
MDKSPDFAKG